MNMFQVDSKAVDFLTSFNFDQPEFMLPEQDYDVYPTGVSSSGVPAPVPPFESNVSSVSLVSETPDDCETLRGRKAEYQIQGEKRQDVQCDPLPEVEKDKKRGRKKKTDGPTTVRKRAPKSKKSKETVKAVTVDQKKAVKRTTVDLKEAPKMETDNVMSDISVEVMEEGCVTEKGEVKEKSSLVELLSEAVESQKGLLIHLSSSLLDCFLKDANYKNQKNQAMLNDLKAEVFIQTPSIVKYSQKQQEAIEVLKHKFLTL